MPAITSQPDAPAWDVDADWWGPTWDVVTSVRAADPDQPHDDAPQVAPAPATSYAATPAPSWGQILATTVRLWISRRRPGPPRVAAWASAVWGAHARLLSAESLSAGLLAAGPGGPGLVVPHTPSPPLMLAARRSPLALPSGRALVPSS